MKLQLDQCTIRSWQWGDEFSLVRYANNRKVWRNLRDRFPHPYTLSDAERWLSWAQETVPETNFAIAVDGAAMGGIGFSLQEDVYHRSAEIGYWLGEEFWGRGIATEAVRAVTAYAFDKYDLCRMYAGVLEWNPASMRVLEKAGYVCEGRLRRSITKDAETIDQVLYAIVRD